MQLAAGTKVVAPGVQLAGEAAARGELPLGFGRQPLARPVRVGHRVVVGDVDDRVLLAPANRCCPGLRVAPVRAGLVAPPRLVVVERHGCAGGVKTTEPATRFSTAARPGNSAAVGVRSATVT